jgi:hypothetical protein
MNNIPNKIKQPSQCCVYCGKSYKLKTNLNKHVVLCEIIDKSRRKKTTIIEEEDILPSQSQMYKMIVELTLKYNKLEQKMELMSKFVEKKKKKVNVLDWLESNIKPEFIFDNLHENINIFENDINMLFNNNFMDVFNFILTRELFEHKNKDVYPIFAFIQKQNVVYIYGTNTNNTNNKNSANDMSWYEISKPTLISILNKLQNKILKLLIEWKKNNQEQINNSDKISEMYNKALMKLMIIDFKNDTIYSKVKSLIYNKMKNDIKSLVEYEFEF